MPLDAGYIQWLKEGIKYAISTDATFAGIWGEESIETTIISCIALEEDAEAEAARQQPFLEGPLAIEKVDVPGLRADLAGRPITVTAPHLGYDAGLVVFVIGVEESKDVERTVLTVLRRLT